MKFAFVRLDDGWPRLAVIHHERLIDLATLAASTGAPRPPDSIASLAGAGERALDGFRVLLAHTSAVDGPWVRAVEEKDILAPTCGQQSNVLAIGLNYPKHAEESGRIAAVSGAPPIVFTKAATSIIGPYDNIVIDPEVSTQMDWEVELGVILRHTPANTPEKAAMEHVFGYMIINDVSARDMQSGWGGQWFKGKSVDRSSPLGPWVVTSDELPDPRQLQLTLAVNGDLKQSAAVGEMFYPIESLIAWLSKGMTLPAGTVIATGTPDGVGLRRDPPEFLRPGDIVESAITGLGRQRNAVVGSDGH